ncbi:MAG: hypothetical protein JXL67_02285, partial [Calditrichaeota bacterium]|nr:hypothetical protein [Calditrichota bacterium]
KIASIQLKKVDVQAGSILDTTQYAEAGLAKILNRLHIPTRDFVIRENLLFEEGDTVNSDLLADNERILRSLTYIEDARIYIKSHGKDEKKVDVLIVIKDVFPIGFDPVVTDLNNYRFELFDKNFAGLGTELRYKFYYNDAKFPPCGHEALYWMNNLHGTFIDGFLQYRYVYGETLVRVNFAKEFLTPRTRFAGGLDLGRISETRIEIENGLKVRVPNAFNFGDIWGGRAFQVGDESSRRTNVLALRYRKDDVTSRPFVSPDSNRYYHDSDLLLGSVVFRKSEYYKSSLIRSFGTTEDIPVGWLYKFTVGLEAGEFYDRPYFGFEFVRTYVKISAGYLGYGMGIGAFYHQQRWQQGAVKFNSTYVAPLLKKHGFRFRNILNLDITLGIRQSEREYIDVDAEIRGISDFELSGKNKMVLSLESIAFSPWELAGFRFAFYAFSDFGFLSDDRHFNRSDFYGIAGLGCRIRNESLVFNTLVLRIGYYPRVPDGYSQWKFDLSSKDPRFFTDIHTLKPHLITYE